MRQVAQEQLLCMAEAGAQRRRGQGGLVAAGQLLFGAQALGTELGEADVQCQAAQQVQVLGQVQGAAVQREQMRLDLDQDHVDDGQKLLGAKLVAQLDHAVPIDHSPNPSNR